MSATIRPHSLWHAGRVVLGAVALTSAPYAVAGAQERLVGGADIAAIPIYQSWRFGTPAAQDSLQVTGASQLSIPLVLRIPLGRRIAVDVTGGYARGAVEARTADGTAITRRLDGPTDLRVRATAQLVQNRVLLTVGGNLPTGTVGLDDAQLDAVRVLGAPALGFRTPVLGAGPGATLGVVLAQQVGRWAVAAGSAYEQRGTYTPIEATIAGVRAPTDLRPGGTVHLSLGASGLAGAHQLSLAVTGDVYASDELRFPGAAGAPAEAARYTLGPTLGVSAQLQVATTRMRDLAISVVERYRTSFTGTDGQTVAGSSGHYLDGTVAGAFGRPRGHALTFAVDGRYQTGLALDNSVTTAGVAAAGLTLGVELPAGRSVLHPYVRVQQGRLDFGAGTTGITGFAFGLSVGSR